MSPFCKSFIPPKGSYSSPKLEGSKEAAMALIVKSLRDISSSMVEDVTSGFRESERYFSIRAVATSISTSG